MKMKKLLLIPALMGTMAMASDYNYEITPVIGYNVAEGNLNLKNEIITGLEMQFNDVDSAIKPEISLLHSGGVEDSATGSKAKTNVTRLGLNGVYEISKSDAFSTFAKAGIGYETMSRAIDNNTDGGFVDAGAGIKIPFTKELALKLEALYMLKKNSHTAGFAMGDSNLAVLAGLNYSFGEKAQKAAPVPVDGDDDNDGVLNSIDKCPTTPAGKPVNADGCFVDGDDDNDGVLNSIDECPTTPAGKSVNAQGCFIDGDDDNDGVLNSIDECPSSPANSSVDNIGCPVMVNLHVKFEFDSSKVDALSDEHIQDFADFLKTHKNYNAKIVGHTDSKGPESYNLSLSAYRANAVKKLIEEKGVDSKRLTAKGLGESYPMADNGTREGRAQNRRIEAELIKN